MGPEICTDITHLNLTLTTELAPMLALETPGGHQSASIVEPDLDLREDQMGSMEPRGPL